MRPGKRRSKVNVIRKRRIIKTKKIIALFLTIVLVFSTVACSGPKVEDKEGPVETKTIKFAHWYAEGHPQHLAILKFKELVEEKSNGSLIVEVYPNAQLGSEDVFIDSVQAGTVEMGSCGTMVSKFLPKIAAAETPFLLGGWKDAKSVLTGELGKELVADLPEASGVRATAITVNGFRQFSSNKPMNSLADFKGQRIRVPNVAHFLKMVEGIGATPIAMSLSELFTALEQNTVDGQENPYATIYANSFYEVQDYVLESNHMFSPAFWIVNEEFYQGLTDEQRAAFDSSIEEAAAYNWEIAEAADMESKQMIADAGVTIIEPDDAFKKDLQDPQGEVYQYFYDTYEGSEEWVKKVNEFLK
jgi:tripartite ATP-independent transporter DctP family solute receptor